MGGLVALVPTAWRRLPPSTIRCVVTWAGLGGILASITQLDHATRFPGHVATLPVASTAAVIPFADSTRASAGLTGARLVDVSDAVCPPGRCAPPSSGGHRLSGRQYLTNLYALSLMDRLDGPCLDVR